MSAGCGEECIDLAGEASKEAAMLQGGEQRVVRIASRCVMLLFGGGGQRVYRDSGVWSSKLRR